MKLDILAFGAHPDDIELGAGATIAKAISKGKKVGVVDLTRGELGTRGTALTRDEEAKEASKILGLSIRENLEFADGFFVNDKTHQLEVIKMIRKYQPEIVLCNAIEKVVYHYIQWKNIEPDLVVDVTGFMDLKMAAVKAYKTQFYDPNNKAAETPITSKTFIDSINFRARDLGRLVGVDHAEGFTVERYVTVDSLLDLK